jgi:hypothetical protein
MLSFRPNNRNRRHSHYKGQLQLKRRVVVQLAPQYEQGLRQPAPRVMQPHMTAYAKRDEQEPRVTAIAMMNHEPPNRSIAVASEPVTLKNQLA